MESTTLFTPITLWKEFNPTDEDTYKKVVKTEVKDGIVYEYFFFTSEKTSDGETRAFAAAAYPQFQEGLPLVVFVNEADCGLDIKRLEYWAKSGYCAASVDSRGESPSGFFTFYPKSLEYCNYISSGRRLTNVDTNAKETCWYHWTVNNRRLITAMLENDFIDKEKIAIYSIHNSSIIALQIIAMDNRIALGAVLYGSCWEGIQNAVDLKKIEDVKLKDELNVQEERQRWLAGICPQSYVPFVKIPFYLALGTNSIITDVDKAYDVVARMPNDKQSRIFLAPRTMDCAKKEYRQNLDKWIGSHFSQCLVKYKPFVKFSIVSGKLTMSTDTSELENTEKIDKVYILYARGDIPNYLRNWQEADVVKENPKLYTAIAEICDADMEVSAFCHILLESGQWISSAIDSVIPSKLGQIEVLPKGRVLYDSRASKNSFVPLNPTICQTMDFLDSNTVSDAEGPFRIKGVSGTAISTYALSDKFFIFDSESVLTFDVFSLKEQKLDIYISTDWGNMEQKLYKTTINLLGGNLWQKVVLPINQFKNESNRQLKDIVNANILSFVAQKKIIINNIVLA